MPDWLVVLAVIVGIAVPIAIAYGVGRADGYLSGWLDGRADLDELWSTWLANHQPSTARRARRDETGRWLDA